jgi:hypothetical protein
VAHPLLRQSGYTVCGPLSVGCYRVSRLGLIAVAPSGGLGEDLATDTDALRSTMTDETLASWKDGPAVDLRRI